MRQFSQGLDGIARTTFDRADTPLSQIKEINQAVAKALGLETCLKPEVSILLELYQAEKSGHKLTVTMLGLLDAIAPTTTLRYLALLEERGAIVRFPHEYDGRATYVRISSAAKAALDLAFREKEATLSASYKIAE